PWAARRRLVDDLAIPFRALPEAARGVVQDRLEGTGRADVGAGAVRPTRAGRRVRRAVRRLERAQPSVPGGLRLRPECRCRPFGGGDYHRPRSPGTEVSGRLLRGPG